MNREALKDLRTDRRLINRRGWISKAELEKDLEALPDVSHKIAPPEEEEAVFVKVAPGGSILVDCQPMEPNEILPYLEPKLLRNPEKPVILYVDAAAEYQDMIRVYDILGSAKESGEDAIGWKVKNISVPTQSEVREYIELFGFNPFESQCG